MNHQLKKIIEDDTTKITNNDLFSFIEKNKNKFNNIDVVNLKDVNNEIIKILEPLQYQDFKKISYLPKKLSHIFNIKNDYLHAGVSPDDDINTSFFRSILYCFISTFLSYSPQQQTKVMINLVNKLKSDLLQSKFKKFDYKKFGYTKYEIANNISDGILTGSIIKYVSDYLYINIFILDIAEDSLYFGNGDEYIPYKKTIFLLKLKNKETVVYEPLYTENIKTFTIDDDVIKKIRELHKNNKINIQLYKLYDESQVDVKNSDIKFTEIIMENLENYISSEKVKNTEPEKKVELITENNIKENKKKGIKCVNINNYLDDDISKNNSSVDWDKIMKICSDSSSQSDESSSDSENDDEDDENESDDENDDENDKSNKNKYNINDIKLSLKLSELQKIAENLNIPTKQKTKSQLIDSIKNKLK